MARKMRSSKVKKRVHSKQWAADRHRIVPMKSLNLRLIAMIAFILAIGALGLLVRHNSSFAWLLENETRLQEFVQHHPWQAWVLGLSIYTIFSLVPGTAGKSVVCGWVFGFWPAVLMVDMGLTLAAIATFSMARFVLREWVARRWGGLTEKLDRGLDNDGAFYLLLMRMAHMPYSLVNYVAGTTAVPLWTFAWTTAVGILPGTMIFVFVGTRIPTLATLSEQGLWQLVDPLLFGLLSATVLIPLFIRCAVRRFQDRCIKIETSADAEIPLSESDELNFWNLTTRQTYGPR